ncbi:lysozyme inhibitor LprI family protein [Jannaschia sp. S6380]|uniref:lysozyme inhibitor LprI family protein n=1 Tax=Jannaschia sp. S6380 TaxID=2926408 RepID=UPI001FF11171|nr:lysozyme inhibitor LprI family protein [Jannaschia sp. S6380]MCK0166828.1 lysozyme inhibitor LprI family protein [Jannaschia sp. S6380]
MTGRMALAALLACLAAPAAAQQPSYDCTRAGTPTEHAVCGDSALARLDVQMADLYRATARRTEGNARRGLRAEQLLWQQWRNTCGGDTACLARRYRERIADFDPSAAVQPTTPAPGVRRLRNGRWEVEMPDGSIRWTPLDGGSGGIIYPNGSQLTLQYVQVDVVPVEIPPPPTGGAPWVEAIETLLVRVVRDYLPPQDHPAYDALHAGYPPPERVVRHIDAIRILGR